MHTNQVPMIVSSVARHLSPKGLPMEEVQGLNLEYCSKKKTEKEKKSTQIELSLVKG